MRRLEAKADEPIRLVQFNRSFHVGGTEVQVVELVRGLGSDYELRLAVTEPGGPLWDSVRSLGFEPEIFPLTGSAMRPNTAFQVARLAKWLHRERIQLVHAQDFYATLLAVPAAKLAGVKVIVGRLDLAHWHSRIQYEGLKRCTQLADHVIANAEAIRQMVIREEGIAPERVTTVRNGLDLERFDARLAAGLTAPLPDTRGEPVVLHVANMNHEVKRQEDLIEASAIARARGLHFQVFLVGHGPRKPQLEARVRALGLQDRVHFLGQRPDVPALYRHAAVGVLCSSAEGLSNAVMEGMAASKAMVVTGVGGNPELIEDGRRGYVVEPFRPELLAEGIEKVLADPERAEQMGKEGRAFVERELTLRHLVEGHDRVYRTVLGMPLVRG